MNFTLARIIFDVVVLTTPLSCSPEMVNYLPYTPANPEVVKLDAAPDGGCIIRYRTVNFKLPKDWVGV